MLRVARVWFDPPAKDTFLNSAKVEFSTGDTSFTLDGFAIGRDKVSNRLYVTAPVLSTRTRYGVRVEHIASFDPDDWRRISHDIIAAWEMQQVGVDHE